MISLLRNLAIRQDAESIDDIRKSLESDISFKGARIWVLISAIILASVGLNMNSTAVIIGAMLISPLMGPINGMGYGLATHDFHLLRLAFQNYIFAVLVSLVTSTLYFAISPLSSAHSELLARTSPTIYDVLVALFGGLAGTISLTTKLKGNVVPGVAIATALMPPLCTAGYGLATGQIAFFLGAFYLFAINTVFIALATVAFSRLMRFPIRTDIDEAKKRHINRLITVVILVTLIPSVYFGYLLVQKERFTENAGRFIRSVSYFGGDYLFKYAVDPDHRIISMVYGGKPLTDADKLQLTKRAKDFGLEQVTLDFEQGLVIGDNSEQFRESDRLKFEISRLSADLQQNRLILDSLRVQKSTGLQLLRELKPLYPEISGCFFADSYQFADSTGAQPVSRTCVLVSSLKPLDRSSKEKIREWLKIRLKNPGILVVFN